MPHSDYRTLIDRGRKAGLATSELYRALGCRPPEDGDPDLGRTDGNGFVSCYNQHGQRVYRPVSNPSQS